MSVPRPLSPAPKNLLPIIPRSSLMCRKNYHLSMVISQLCIVNYKSLIMNSTLWIVNYFFLLTLQIEIRFKKHVDMRKLLITLFALSVITFLFGNNGQTSNYGHNNAKLDSLNVKIATMIDRKKHVKAASLMFEKGKLFFEYGMYVGAVTILDNAITVLNISKIGNRDSLWSDTYVECMNWKGISLAYMSNFDKALECYVEINRYNENKNNRYAAKAYTGMGMVFAMNNNRLVAEEYYKKALAIARRIEGFNLFPLYSNLGATFMAKKSLDSAQIYFLDAHKLAVIQNDRGKEIASLQSLGMVNFKLKKYSLALKYYNEAVDIAVAEGNYSQLSFLKCNMIDSYVKLGDYESAFKVATESFELARNNGSKVLEAASLKALSSLHEMNGDYKRALMVLKAGLKISDSVFSHESEDKLLKQKADFDLYRTQSEHALIENELALELANRKINNMITWFIVVVLVVLLYAVSHILIRQYRINRRLNSKIENIQTDDENIRNRLQQEIDMKSQELTTTSLLIVKFNELSYLLNTKLRILKVNLSMRSKEMELVKEMEELILQFAPERSWEQFGHYFEQISPVFYDKLDILYPELTLGEKRLCTLISLNLTTKDIASLTGKSGEAINMAKCRIRKKMKIGLDDNIADVLLKIK